jgi:bacterioferritin (cytochrome b1)
MSKDKMLELLNKGLELEHAARIQYLSHAELIDGLEAEPIIARLKEIAADEEKHEEKFRTLIGDYLGGTPSMGMAKTSPAKTVKEILEVNLKNEREAVDFYKQILEEANKNKANLPYEFMTIEHEVRHILIDEQEHIAELKILLGLR